MMDDFFRSGRVADLVLLFMAAEFAVLFWRRRARGRTAAIDLVFAIAPGACIVLALRAALTDAGPVWIGAALAASLPFHLVDLARRRP